MTHVHHARARSFMQSGAAFPSRGPSGGGLGACLGAAAVRRAAGARRRLAPPPAAEGGRGAGHPLEVLRRMWPGEPPGPGALAAGAGAVAALLFWTLCSAWAAQLNSDCLSSQSVMAFEDPEADHTIPLPSILSEPCKRLTVVVPAFNEARRDPLLPRSVRM